MTRPHVEEVLVVDDGSADGTAGAAADAGATVLRHERNRGKGEALKTGFDEALRRGFDAAVTIDADGQHDPAHVPTLQAAQQSAGADVVVASRWDDLQHMRWNRRLANRLSSAVVSLLCGQRIEDSQSGYRLILTSAWERSKPQGTGYDAESEFLVNAARLGLRIHCVRVGTLVADGTPTSHYRPLGDALQFVRAMWRMRRRTRSPSG